MFYSEKPMMLSVFNFLTSRAGLHIHLMVQMMVGNTPNDEFFRVITVKCSAVSHVERVQHQLLPGV